MTGRPYSERTAVIVGAAGQDGTYLNEHLEGLGYTTVRIGRSTVEVGGRTEAFSILDRDRVRGLIRDVRPDEAYYLAAYHHSAEEQQASFIEVLQNSMAVHFDGSVNLLQSIVDGGLTTRVFVASSVLVFGDLPYAPQDEATAIRPTTPYGISKAAAMAACSTYRRQFGLFAATGIFYNHESSRRAPKFVSKKIARAAAAAARGEPVMLRLGALDVELDWSAAQDAVRAAHAVLQVDEPRDYVIASGEIHSVREFAEVAFSVVGLDYARFVEVDGSVLQRTVASVPRHGNPNLLRRETGFRPAFTFDAIVRGMVEAELEMTA